LHFAKGPGRTTSNFWRRGLVVVALKDLDNLARRRPALLGCGRHGSAGSV
jgi:hypothetical protein